MTFAETIGLGAIAGFTILLGLPVARVKNPHRAWQAFLNAVASGILVFLFWDILSKAKEAKGFANDQGQIEMPFTLSGKLPGARPKPDMNYVARAMQKGFMERGFGNFGGGKKSRKEGAESSTAENETPSGTPEKKKKRSTQDQIRRGLEQLFGK